MGSAQSVYSTTYPHFNYEAYAQCGDGFPGPGWGNGVGLCTGTSMSAPQIAGVLGLLRSINPLVPAGGPTDTAPVGLRSVMSHTASGAGTWSPVSGYGIPDAAAAAAKMLGKVAGHVVRNRVTPLFRLYTHESGGPIDYAETTSPQLALSLMINQAHNYVQPTSLPTVPPISVPTVPGYPLFPYDHVNEAAPATPRASIYVMTTEYTPNATTGQLLPLYLMEKPKTGGADYMLVTPVDLVAAHNAGYNLHSIQGYIYPPCTPAATCKPPGSHPIYRGCNTAANDCATYLDTESAAFSTYTTHYPGSTYQLGYAYDATDTDADGLPDGFEIVVGTAPTIFDSNGSVDGSGHQIADGAKMPLAGVEISDPCLGGAYAASRCPGDIIFRNGFQ